ncbi:MAG TPA: hypothetical protein PLO78_10035 [Candidatus Omnitrophota bacterium]|nr:hypothetical protein [Candidatus Omnitrophota bacterium]
METRRIGFFQDLFFDKKRYLDVFVLLAYFFVTLGTVLHHVPWRDEAIPWLMARDSSLSQMLFEHLQYELHPMAWYLLLFVLTHLGFPYITLSIFHLGIAFLAVLIFIWKAPLPRITKYAFVFSYYMMSEYAVIARHYALTILVLFCVAACYQTRFEKPLRYGALVALLFNTEYLCFTGAAGLVALYGWEVLRKRPLEKDKAIVWGIMILGLVLAMWQIIRVPPDQNYYYTTHEDSANLRSLTEALKRMFFPAPWGVPGPVALASSVAILAGLFFYFLRKPQMMFLMAAAYAGIFYILLFKHRTPDFSITRHYGFLLIFLMFFLWLRDTYPCPKGEGGSQFFTKEKIFSWAYVFLITSTTLCLLYSIRYTYFSHRMDYYLPYSGAKNMAAVIREFSQRYSAQDYVIVGYPQDGMAPIIPYLPERKFWDPQRRDFKTYVSNKMPPEEDRDLNPQEVIVRAGIRFQDISRLLFVFSEPLPFSEAYGYIFQKIYAADNAWGTGPEMYYLYMATKKKE